MRVDIHKNAENGTYTITRGGEITHEHLAKDEVAEIIKDIIRSTKKCPRCHSILSPSDIPDYAYVCYNCDENFYHIEVDGIDEID